ncbi:MAG: DUF547 domain-containing protein [Pseudomonadota bacterium]
MAKQKTNRSASDLRTWSLRALAAGAALLLGGAAPALERLAVAKSKLVDPMWAEYDGRSVITVDHDAWDAFLSSYVALGDDGVARVAYADVTPDDRAALDAYLAALQDVDPRTLNRDVQLAYWTNLYNARTVALILDNYPVSSIRKIKSGLLSTGPWGREIVEVNGQGLSLNDIESGIVRPVWNEPRIHYIFNCAALGCPNLGAEAYRGAKIDAQMTAAAEAYVNNPRGVRIGADGEATLSKIYSWYLPDFGGDEAGVLAEIRKHAKGALSEALAGDIEIDAYEYDWALNDAATE